MKTRSFALSCLVSSMMLLATTGSHAQEETHPIFINHDGIGFARKDSEQTIAYDPVAAYDQHATLVADCSRFKAELEGITWCFANAENVATFNAATSDSGHNKYLPFGGGHCSLGLAFNNLAARGDPRTAVRVGDKLVLNGNFDVRARFLEDTTTNMSRAAENFDKAVADGKLIP